MIQNQWYIVLDSREVGKELIGVTRLGEKLVLWRDEAGHVHCLQDRCVHRGAALSLGKKLGEHVQCPFHGFEYDRTGKVRVIPANGKTVAVPDRFRVKSYPVHEEAGFLWMYYSPQNKQPPTPPRFFSDLGQGFSYSSLRDHWPIHYSRAIENQLDVVHLPFVHYNTIGRGNRTVVDGPLVEWVDPERFFFFVYNRVDDGNPARKPEAMSPPDFQKDFKLSFIFPNLWQNYIALQVRVMAAFVPVDEENTLIYLRFYQSFLRLPLLKKWVNNLAMIFNRKILNQDKRIVLSQQPRKTWLKMGETLIQGDAPILEYRKRRQELQDE